MKRRPIFLFLLFGLILLAGCNRKIHLPNAPKPMTEYLLQHGAQLDEGTGLLSVPDNGASEEALVLYLGELTGTIDEIANRIANAGNPDFGAVDVSAALQQLILAQLEYDLCSALLMKMDDSYLILPPPDRVN